MTVIMFENTHDSSVKNCDFLNIGGYAFWLHLDSQRNVFDRNTVRHSGGGGVLLTGSRLGYMDDSKVYTPGKAAAAVAPILNRITNNTVEHCGKIRYYGGGVHLDSRPFSMTMAPGNYIAHNLFNDLSLAMASFYNTVGGPVKVIFGGNQNVTQSDNRSSETVITPPFAKEVGPGGTATNGIDLTNNKLTGTIVSYTDTAEEKAIGIVSLFEFEFLTSARAERSQAIYHLPITEDGNYQISLLYQPGKDRASNVPVEIDHADGIARIDWDMRKGSRFGFAIPVGTYRFVASGKNTVTLSAAGVNGKVIADSVAFVKVSDQKSDGGPRKK
jgi:Right handed beta helix region